MIKRNTSFINIDTERLIRKLDLQTGGEVQKAIDKAVVDWCQIYTPWRTGALSKSAYTATKFGSGEVVFDVPYAEYVYYGETASGKEMNYSKAHNALAGPFWVERMKADHMGDIVKVAQETAKKAKNKKVRWFW